MKEKFDELDFIKIKNSEVFTKCLSDKGLMSKMYKEFLKLNKRK